MAAKLTAKTLTVNYPDLIAAKLTAKTLTINYPELMAVKVMNGSEKFQVSCC